MILLLMTLSNIFFFTFGWMLTAWLLAIFTGIVPKWKTEWLKAIFCGMVFAFIMMLIR